MRSQSWFDAYEEAFNRLEEAGAPAALISEAAAEMANVSIIASAFDRADALRDRMKEARDD